MEYEDLSATAAGIAAVEKMRKRAEAAEAEVSELKEARDCNWRALERIKPQWEACCAEKKALQRRAEVSEAEAHRHSGENVELRIEVQRLRAALQVIRDGCIDYGGGSEALEAK